MIGMPTYRNDDWTKNPRHEAISYNGTAWGEGEQKDVNFFVPDEKGLRKVSDDPRVSDICLYPSDAPITLDATATRIYIPDCNGFLLSVVCKSGGIELRRNYSDANPTTIDAGASFLGEYKRSLVEAIYLSAPSGSGIATINIERIA